MLTYKRPDMDTMIRFIHDTHDVERLPCPVEDVQAALKRTHNPNPFVVGHFDAMNFLFSLLGSPDFPAKEHSLLTNVYRSEETLFWLRGIHEKMTLPCAKVANSMEWEDQCAIYKQQECGVLRNVPAINAFSYAPQPELIPFILHNWLLHISELHQHVKDKVDNPYGLTKEEAHDLNRAAHETVLTFANLQPFSHASNRLARLVENLLRLTWRLPWKDVPKARNYEAFVKEVQNFGLTKMPDIIKKAKELT